MVRSGDGRPILFIEVDRRIVPLLMLIAAACTGTPAPGVRTPTVAAAPPTPKSVTPLPSEQPAPWFAPLPPLPTSAGRPYTGSDDFMDLFGAGAPWSTAAGHVKVFKLYGEWVAGTATDQDLVQVVAGLRSRRIGLAVEVGPLTPTAECGSGVEGFAGTPEGLKIAHRIEQAGGTIEYLALDEPFAFGHLYDGPHACHWPAEKIAREVADYARSMKSVFPEVQVGDIEPLWTGAGAGAFEDWLRTYAKVSGDDFPFFHLDPDFSRPDWMDQAKSLEGFCRARGLDFGVIYIGQGDTDQAFATTVEDRYVSYEARARGRPDQVIFQSWLDKPDRVLPETTPTSFTWLIDRYFRIRTSLDLEVGPSQLVGSLRASGILTDASGQPVTGASILVTVTPVDGPGSLETYSITGTVPPGAVSGVAGVRVNTECECVGASDLSLYDVAYSEGGRSNSVPDGDFASGLTGWGLYGDDIATLKPSDRGGGSMLLVRASPRQTVIVNSPDFGVRSGESFSVSFDARVAPKSVGSGYFTLVFLGASGEVSREQIPFAPATFEVGTRTTDQQGAFGATFHPPGVYLHLGKVLVEASFAGDDRHWPAYRSGTATA